MKVQRCTCTQGVLAILTTCMPQRQRCVCRSWRLPCLPSAHAAPGAEPWRCEPAGLQSARSRTLHAQMTEDNGRCPVILGISLLDDFTLFEDDEAIRHLQGKRDVLLDQQHSRPALLTLPQ
jgi:hypothetical protein